MKTFLKWFGVGLLILIITLAVLLVIDQILPAGWKLSPEILLGISAVILSLTLTYLPGLRVDFAKITSTQKALVNVVLTVLLATVMFLGTCLAWFTFPELVCTSLGLKTLMIYVVIALGANQLTYVPSVKPSDVLDTIKERDQS